MLFVSGRESVDLIPENIKGKQFRKNQYTIDEAAIYWAGFAQIGRSDINAMFKYETVFNMFYDSYQDGKLNLCVLSEYDGRIGSSSQMITVSGRLHVFRWCKVARNSLVEFAYAAGEYPLFLFQSGKPKEKSPYGGSRADKAAAKKQALICDVNSLLSESNSCARKKYHNGETFNKSEIIRKLINDNKKSALAYDSDGGARAVLSKAIQEGLVVLPNKK